MNSKIFNFTLLVLIIVFSLSFISAYPVTIGVNSADNSNFNTAVYHCTSSVCTNFDITESTLFGNYNSFSLPNRGTGTQYFAEYSYQTCTIPWMWRWDISPTTGNGPWNKTTDSSHASNYIRNFQQRINCNATVNQVTLSNNNINLGDSVTINTNIGSALIPHIYLGAIPIALRNAYSTNTTVILRENGVEIERKYISVVVLETGNLAFTYTPSSVGIKNIQIATIFDKDCKCSGYVEKTNSTQVLIVNPAITQCNDGIDNDGDGFIDLADFSCSNSLDNDETNPKAQCQDGIDNDGDGFIDLADSGCSNTQDNDETNIILDLISPTLNVFSPLAQIYNTNNILVNFTASDNVAIDSLWYFNGTTNRTYTLPQMLNLSNGTYTFTFYANDTSGNLAQLSRTFSVNTSSSITDNVLPTLNVFSPLAQIYNISNILINFTATDNVVIDRLWYFNGSSNISYNSPNVINLVNGTYNFIFYANDTSGNLASLTRNFVVNTSSSGVDSIIPTINVFSPLAQTYNSGSILVNFTATDNVAIDRLWYFNGLTNVSYTTPQNLNLVNGTYNFIFYANDTSGNLAQLSRSFIIKTNSSTDDNDDDDDGGSGSSNNRSYDSYFTSTHQNYGSYNNTILNLGSQQLISGEDKSNNNYLFWFIILILAILILILAILILIFR